MNNTLTDLNNYLFEQLERLNDDELDDEGLDREIRKSPRRSSRTVSWPLRP